MADFPDIGYPSSVSESNKIDAKKAQFGDGYAQRARPSINSALKMFDVSYQVVSPENKQIVDEFIKPKQQLTPFNWTDPISSTTYSVICEEYSAVINSVVYDINLKLEEVV